MVRQHRPGSRVVTRRPSVRREFAAQAIVLPRPREVNAYLRQQPHLFAIVIATCVDARREFGECAELSLELYRDPEIDDSYLTLYVRQFSYSPDLLPRIHRLSELHAKRSGARSGHMLITTDFRAPRRPHGL